MTGSPMLGSTTVAAAPNVLRAGARADGSRLSFIDNARAIGIVLVVVGHAPGLPAPLINFIFAFHMPLFFLLSGLVVSGDRLALTIVARARLLARTLLVPYLSYFVLAYVYWLVAKRHGLRGREMESLPWWDPFVGFVTGNADGLYVDVALWFFPCLFLTALAHHVLRKYLAAAMASVASIVMAFVFILFHDADWVRWPWSADCAVVSLAFYAVGASLHTRLRHLARASSRRALAAAALVAAIACYAITRSTGRVDLNHLAFGDLPLLYPPMACLGIVAALALARILPASRLSRWLSMNTVVVFPLHFLFFSVFTGFGLVVLGLDPAFKTASTWVGIVYIAFALLLSWPAAIVLKSSVPSLIGVQPRTTRRTDRCTAPTDSIASGRVRE